MAQKERYGSSDFDDNNNDNNNKNTEDLVKDVEENPEETVIEDIENIEEVTDVDSIEVIQEQNLEEAQEENVNEEKEWYFVEYRKPKGPFSRSEMAQFVDDGTIDEFTMVWKAGMKRKWVHLSESELSDLIQEEKSVSHKKGHKLFNLILSLLIAALLCGAGYVVYQVFVNDFNINDVWKLTNEQKDKISEANKKEREKDNETVISDQYKAVEDANVYKTTDLSSEIVTTVGSGTVFSVSEIQTIDTNIWGKIDQDQWICIQEGDQEHFSKQN